MATKYSLRSLLTLIPGALLGLTACVFLVLALDGLRDGQVASAKEQLWWGVGLGLVAVAWMSALIYFDYRQSRRRT